MKIQINQNIFNKAFLPALTNDKRYCVLVGGGGSGKSVFGVQKTIIKGLQSKRKILIVRKVARTLKDSIYSEILKQLEFFQIRRYCNINKTTLTITLPNGSVLLFRGMDCAEKIKSISDITDIVIEEATEVTQDDFIQLDLRLRHATARNQEIMLMFNPISKRNWCYTYWGFAGEPREDTFYLKTTYKDNRFLPQSYIETLESLAKYSKAHYTVYCLGEFATLDKLVFTNFKVRAGVAVEFAKEKKLYGMDFGFTADPTTLIELYYDKQNRRIYITGELYRKGMLTDDIANHIKKHNIKSLITADSAEPRTIAELRNKQINIRGARKGRDSIIHGITWLQGHEIIIDASCLNTLEEFNNYTWKKDKKTNEYFNEPIDNHNHCIDAIRYAVEELSLGNKPAIMSKNLLGL